MTRPLCLLPFAFCLLTSLALASVWSIDGTDSLLAQIDKVEFRNVSIRPDGRITLAPALTELAAPPEAAVWELARDRGGSIYLGTGHSGRLYRQSHGKTEVVRDTGSGEVLAVATDAAGNVCFGTTPDGNVYRIDATGEPQLLYATGESYVFALLAGPGRDLLCATGEHGKLYRIAPDGKATEVFATSQAHLTALAWLVQDRELLVGTAPDGVVYKLSFDAGGEKPRVTVLYDTPLNEVRSIAADASGRVFIAANPSTDGGRDSANPKVYMLDANGIVRWSWPCPDSVAFALHLLPQTRLLVATGNRGIVYDLDSMGHASVLYRTPESQVLCLVPQAAAKPQTLFLGTGNVARVYTAGPGLADSGTIESPPHDCVNPARFGRLDWRGNVPAGTELAFDTRTGNSEKPDSTWSDWLVSDGTVRSPQARFIQWRARFSATFPNLTPTLERVDLYYQTANRAPSIRKLDVAGVPPDDSRKGYNRSSRTVTWEASDPDDDSLAFELYFRGKGETGWLRLQPSPATARLSSPYDLDSRALPDGWYEIRLVVSDKPDQTSPLVSDQVTRSFPIDNTAPVIANLRISPSATRPLGPSTPGTPSVITFSAVDALSPIVAARVSVNAGEWLPAETVDGILDSQQESFTAEITLATGENRIAVWASDAQGNVGTTRTVLTR